MASLMVDAEEGDLLLCDDDFPDNFVHMAHPDDGKITQEPIPLEFIRHQRLMGHHRLILRTSIKLGDGEFISFSFVLDTCAPASIYFSPGAAFNALKGKRVIEDGDVVYMEIVGKKAAVKETPHTHRPANIIGLPLLERFELGLKGDRSFSFAQQFACL